MLLAETTRLFFDVDDTLTWRGQLPEVAARALYAAKDIELSLVAVTGRSFAWAEMMMRMFPLDAAIAETGACALVRKTTHLEVIHVEPDPRTRRENARVRDAAADKALAAVATARLALDNNGRIYDTAFDLVEDGPPVSDEDAARIRAILEGEGLTTAQSSVHINAWKVGPHGPFDKATMVDRVLRERFSTSLAEAAPTLAYLGDSKNDGAMFARADVSIGVGNVRPHLDWLAARAQAPRFLVDSSGGYGFADAVRLIVDAKHDVTLE
jgi:HAD superfamily hydrolase (TIGR01484 family)